MRNLSQNARREPAATLGTAKDEPQTRRWTSLEWTGMDVAWSVPLLRLNAGECVCGSASNLWDDPRGEEPSIYRDTLARNISSRRKAEEGNQPGYLFRFSDSA
jgi:hypothetical protein